jgi:hypothetical protein
VTGLPRVHPDAAPTAYTRARARARERERERKRERKRERGRERKRERETGAVKIDAIIKQSQPLRWSANRLVLSIVIRVRQIRRYVFKPRGR